MRRICVCAAVLFLACVLSAGQASPPESFNQWKVYGGYQYTMLDTHAVQDALNLQHALDPTFPLINFGDHQDLGGWNFGVQNDITKWFGVVVDVGSGYGTNNINVGTVGAVSVDVRTKLRLYTFTGGPQFTLRRSSKIEPFARILIGGAWTSSSTNVLENKVPLFAELKAKEDGFAYGGGGGVDFFFSRKAGLRVAADLIRTPFSQDTQNNIRATAGLVIRF